MTSIFHTTNEVENAIQRFEKARTSIINLEHRPSLVVKGEAVAVLKNEPTQRTAKRHGLSVAERKLMSEGFHRFRQRGWQPLWIVIEAHDASEREARELFDKVKSDFGQIQRRAQCPRYWVEVLEAECAVHSNLIGPVPIGRAANDIIERLEAYSYGEHLKVQKAYDLPGLANYLSKEATSQAWFAANHRFRRLRGPHPLGQGGGDRVRLSHQLADDLIQAGSIQPRKKTYASRSLPKSPPRPVWTSETNGQLRLFDKPCQIPLKEFHSGIMPASVAEEIEERRLALGLSQREFGERIGLSQPQYSNVIKGRFGMGRTPVAIMQGLFLAA